MLLGITFTAIVLAKVLAALNRLYGRVTGTAPTVRVMLPWRSGLRPARPAAWDRPTGFPSASSTW